MVGIIALLGTALAAPTCPQGQEVVHRKGHCCWPGQSWSWSKKQCSGMPRQCPDGWSVVRPPPGSTQPATCQDLKTLDGVFGSSDRAGVLGALRHAVGAFRTGGGSDLTLPCTPESILRAICATE